MDAQGAVNMFADAAILKNPKVKTGDLEPENLAPNHE